MPGEVDIWCADALKQTADDVTIAVSVSIDLMILSVKF